MAVIEETSDKSPGQLLQENGMYVFMGEVDHDSIKPIIEWILHENYVAKKRDIFETHVAALQENIKELG